MLSWFSEVKSDLCRKATENIRRGWPALVFLCLVGLLEDGLSKAAEPSESPFEQPVRPSEATVGEGRNHWAFQPVESSSRPDVLDQSWPLTDVDYFLLSRLERAGLNPITDADRYTWLRRVHYDLIGLPPTLDEIRNFQQDASPLAYAIVVDRLLASRAFGERWARHWLDLVGYADQIGTSNNVFAEHAWRYRDYIIDALNADKPFDRFIREQIAGDLLEYDSVKDHAAGLAATGFLVLGDLEIVEADKAKLFVDVIDQQVVKMGKAFLGLTIGCARCHDHKFDPISQRDYYALAGFFHGTQSVYKTGRGVWSDVLAVEVPETEAEQVARAAQTRQHANKISALKEERIQAVKRKSELDKLIENNAQRDGTTESTDEHVKERNQLVDRINRLDGKIEHGEFFTPAIPRVYGVHDVEQPGDMRITIRGNPHALGEEVRRGFLQVISAVLPEIPDHESGRRQLADWLASPANPLTARVAVNRIWEKLFGMGLVRSVDYFGVRGERPSHPQLLDYLATNFVMKGWSQKQIIRSIVLSRTYRLSSESNGRACEVDSENRLLWRMNRRRLDAEALRDSILAVSGQLQPSKGGPAIPLEFPENVANIDPENVNPPSFNIARWRPEQAYQRTIYLPVIRSGSQPGPAELRNVFDFTQPAQFVGQRATTAVPTQALFLMNSSFMKRHAQNLAEWSSKAVTDGMARLDLLWLRTFSRPITPEEKIDAEVFLEQDQNHGWVELCHALLASNEFLMRL